MFRKYGLIGLILIILVEINFFLQVEPFARWYFPIIWFGYILLMDALIYSLKKSSIIMNNRKQFFLMLALSSIVWWGFEIINYLLQNWDYENIVFSSRFELLMFGWLSFATVIPAVMETADLIKTIRLFDKIKLKQKYNITKKLLYSMIGMGISSFVLIMFFPKYLFPFIWWSFYLIIDPINYLNKQPSIIKHIKDRKLAIPLSLFAAGIFCGLLWELWNYWALPRWVYILPAWAGPKIFEMPILGYMGYAPFAWEVYAAYYFVRSLLLKGKKEVIGV